MSDLKSALERLAAHKDDLKEVDWTAFLPIAQQKMATLTEEQINDLLVKAQKVIDSAQNRQAIATAAFGIFETVFSLLVTP